MTQKYPDSTFNAIQIPILKPVTNKIISIQITKKIEQKLYNNDVFKGDQKISKN